VYVVYKDKSLKMSEVDANSLFDDGQSEPPDVTPAQTIPANNLSSEFWSRKGSARKRPAGDAANVVEDDVPQFTGISLTELEFTRRNNNVGASSIASEVVNVRSKKKKKTKNKPPAEMMASAAFGGGDEESQAQDDNEDDEDDEEPGKDDEGGVLSKRNSTAVVEEELSSEDGDESVNVCKPITNDRCIGCCFDREIIGKVDTFVRSNCGAMTEAALYRAASAYWNREIVQPRRAEGVTVPSWAWKDISNHYTLHSVDPLLQRTSNLRVVAAMREFQTQSLLRVNADGTKQLDQKSADLMLKLIALSDKHIAALDSARMPPPSRGSR
jgi:hypothetical protein